MDIAIYNEKLEQVTSYRDRAHARREWEMCDRDKKKNRSSKTHIQYNEDNAVIEGYVNTNKYGIYRMFYPFCTILWSRKPDLLSKVGEMDKCERNVNLQQSRSVHHEK